MFNAYLFLVSEAVSNVPWRLSSSSSSVVEWVSVGVGRAEDMGFVMPQVFSALSIEDAVPCCAVTRASLNVNVDLTSSARDC